MVYDRFVAILLLTVGQKNYNLHRKLLRLEDGGTLCVPISNYHPSNFFCSGLDFAPPTAAGRVFDKETPVIVALHGLTGGTLMKPGGVAHPVVLDIC